MRKNFNTLTPCRAGFTLIEVMIVVAILGIILAIAGSTWLRQREISRLRVCQENLTKIEGAKQQWALENNRPGTIEPDWGDLVAEDGSGYIKFLPVCPAEGEYAINIVNETATCSIEEPDHNQVSPTPVM